MWNSKKWLQITDEHKDELIALRRHFHRNAELSEHEFETQAKICQLLDEEGIYYEKIAKTGVMAIVNGESGGKVIGLRADMDALPIQERNIFDYASKTPDAMHACGHDAHMTIAIVCAKILHKNRTKWNGIVKFFFQPAEETIGGADRMIKEGCLENPDVDYCIGLHVMPNLDVGKVELKYGELNAATDSFQISVLGKSGHGAIPDKCIDSIVISAQIINSLETIVSRNVSPLDQAVLTIGQINGGVAGNVIASRVEMHGTLRTPNGSLRLTLHNKVRKMVEGIAIAMGGTAFVKFEHGYPPVINDDAMVTELKKTMTDFFGEENVVMREKMSMGGEDFSFFGEKVKSMFYHLGCKISTREPYLLHSPNFDIDEDCLNVGVKAHIAMIMRLLEGDI